jgi:hypothetical protein
VRGNLWWLLAAIVWHGLTNLIAVGVLQVAGPLASEAALAVIAAINLWALFRLRKSPLAAPGMEPASAR